MPSKRWKCRFSVPKFKKISGSIPPDLPNLESVPLTFWDGLTPLDALPTELHGQTDLRLEIMKYILMNVINILVYINSASNNTSSASVMLCDVVCRGRQHLSACAGYGNYIIHTLEHFHLNILQSVQLHN